MRVAAIDPGLGGAIALLGPGPQDVLVWDMPVLTLVRNGKARRQVDYVQLHDVLLGFPVCDWAVIEQVGAMPHDGPVQAFAFGKATGIAVGVMSAALKCPLEEVPPSVWKRVMRITAGAGKDASRARATALFPTQARQWPLKKHDGRAEAALLAAYQRQVLVREGWEG